MNYASVLVNIKGLGVKTFSYLIPDEMKDIIKIGQAVSVPFGRQGLIKAFVVGFSDYVQQGIKSKKIKEILDKKQLFNLKYFKLLEWVANYYCTDIINVLNLAIPVKLIDKNAKMEYSVEYLTSNGVTKRRAEILELLKNTGKCSLIEFEQRAKTTRTTMKKLEEAGCIKITEENIYRNPLSVFKDNSTEPLSELSDEQEEVYEAIKRKIKSPNPILLHGVTASGKTEVYFKLIKDILAEGKNVLFLLPEIALASQITRRIARKFGINDVAIWHSSISDGEKYDVWQRLYNNEIRILAGARSAVFAPLQNIGLIIIDEEHESSYKQTNPAPRYDAKVVAHKLSQFYKAPLILGSATPDISTYYFASNNNNLFELPHRFNNSPMAKIDIINMQEYSKAAYRGVISKPLQTAIDKTLENNQQIIILINRRGYSTSTQCKACGAVIECPNCAIPLIWHANDRVLKCHYCNHVESMPEFCPVCGSDALRNSGLGSQKVEILLKELYPDINIERIDSDILTKKNAHIEILNRFNEHKTDILIGTQMIAKGLDNPNVTLVGVISADAPFNLPDFRSAERGFQLLTQVAGRAGRGEYLGRVLFQTYNPDFYALESAREQDYAKFYNTEIRARQDFNYPPFTGIIRVILSCENNNRAEKSVREIADRLSELIDNQGFNEHLELLGPSNCVIERLNGLYRYQILLKNKLHAKGHQFILKFFKSIKLPKDIRMAIDVDPIDIL
ncbi:MAG: primosomal protein N' [Candidatus Gastranaerophilales bacterium]|nr:primosomal protein N' [Candidatus Gastranaerophilales bacterium]